jgi:hypothetical protein
MATDKPDDTSVTAWRDWAKADAERRGLPQLAPLIDGLSTTVARLRAGDWNHDARRETASGHEHR